MQKILEQRNQLFDELAQKQKPRNLWAPGLPLCFPVRDYLLHFFKVYIGYLLLAVGAGILLLGAAILRLLCRIVHFA